MESAYTFLVICQEQLQAIISRVWLKYHIWKEGFESPF